MDDDHYPNQVQGRSLASCLFTTLQKHTWGSLSIDLKRSHILDDAFEDSAGESGHCRSDDLSVGSGGSSSRETRRERFSTNGARFKVMRHVSMGPKVSCRDHGKEIHRHVMDVGVGVCFELDSARIRPKARLKIMQSVCIGVFPCPHVKVQKRIPIGLTGFSIRGSYFCPLSDVMRFYRRPARLIITLDDDQNYGLRLTHSGVEMAGNTWIDWKGWQGYLQASGVVHLPHMLDLQGTDSSALVPWVEPMRCGLKTFW